MRKYDFLANRVLDRCGEFALSIDANHFIFSDWEITPAFDV